MEWWGNSFLFSQLWTPARIATELWLDASDSATIVTVSGGVSQWLDKSGKARHATQDTDSQFRPVNTANTINSLPVVTFDGVNDYMDVVSTFLQGQTQINLFYVFSRYGAGSGDAYKPVVAPLASNNADLGAFHYVKNTNNLGASYPFSLGVNPSWGSYDLTSGTAYASNAPEIIGFNALSTNWRVYRNGTQEGPTRTVGAAPTSVFNGLRLARQQSPARISHVGIGELMVAFGLADAQRQIVEGYLAHKWGLVTSLPSDHPYKSAPPYA